VVNAMRSLEIEYTIHSFFRDPKEIRSKTFKHDTIVHAFRDSGMWPVSWKAAKKKMREYKRHKRPEQEEEEEEDVVWISQLIVD
jgi:hypothetical protein